MIVVASAPGDVTAVRSRLGELDTRVVSCSDSRSLVIAAIDDEWQAERIVATLRTEGEVAVTRPDGGARLDAWMAHTRPARFGPRLSVCAAWCEHDRASLPGLIELGLGGFGNGQHPTTSMLIEQLLERVSGDERVLDLGCGSGVLGLCALQLGAQRVVALDMKLDAVEATARNAALNGMTPRVEASIGPLESVEGAFDIVLANVGRSAIVELAPQLVGKVAPGGWLAVSGFSPAQRTQVAGFLQPLEELENRTSGEWSALVLAHPDRP